MVESGGSPVRKSAGKKTAAKRAAKKATTRKAASKQAKTRGAAAKKSQASKTGSRFEAARDLARSAPGSRYFDRARARAQQMADDPEALRRIADEAYLSGSTRGGPFDAIMDDFRALVRLVVAYARGHYRDVPPDILVVIVAGLVYVVSPIDVIPDAVPGVGLLDDVGVIGWVIKSVRVELDKFRAWELGQ